MAYVYKFYVGEEIAYIGYTEDMKVRMGQHFTRMPDKWDAKILTVEQVLQITKIEYTETGMANARVLEAYLIAKEKPLWNKDFVERDELTFELVTGKLEWREWEITIDDNPGHHIFVWKDDVLLYEIPKVHEVYDALCRKLGIEQDMNFGYSSPVYTGGYKLMRLSGKRRIKTGSQRQVAKESFMGYPEAWGNV